MSTLSRVDDVIDRKLTHDRALLVVTAGIIAASVFGRFFPPEYTEATLLGINLIWIWR